MQQEDVWLDINIKLDADRYPFVSYIGYMKKILIDETIY